MLNIRKAPHIPLSPGSYWSLQTEGNPSASCLQNLLADDSCALQHITTTARSPETTWSAVSSCMHVTDSQKVVWITELHQHGGVRQSYAPKGHVSSRPLLDVHWPHTPRQDGHRSSLYFWIIKLGLCFAVKIHSPALTYSSGEECDTCVQAPVATNTHPDYF